MLLKKTIQTILLVLAVFSSTYAEPLRSITIGYSDNLDITKEAANLICLGFEADHPNNHCSSQYVEASILWEMLINNDIQVALMPEEILLANRRQKIQPIIITPLYQQYLLLVGNNELSVTNPQSFQDRTIGVLDWATKEHRGIPLASALGLKEQDIYFPIANTATQLLDQFCSLNLDGIVIMSEPSSSLARELSTSCDGHILSFTDQQIQKIIQSNTGFYPAMIPHEMYWRTDEDIKTLKSRVILVINPQKNVANAFFDSIDHIEDELDLTTLRTKITPESILETYDINPIKLNPNGQAIIDHIREKLTPTEEPSEMLEVVIEP